MNRRDRRRIASGHAPAIVHAGNLPRQKPAPTPPASGQLPFPAAPVVAVLLRKLKATGDAGYHVTADDLAALETEGVEVLARPAPDGGLILGTRATKQPGLVTLAGTKDVAAMARARMG